MLDKIQAQLPWNRLSVIVPALNEERNIDVTLDRLTNGCSSSTKPEIIVVDGGSSDQTPAVARRHGAKVVESARGRGVQQNRGLEAATGDWCLFVHADTELPAGYDSLMSQAIDEQSRQAAKPAQWGCFKSIQATGLHPINQWILHQGVALRTSWRHTPYGDQAIFASSSALQQVGGFKEWPLLEDVDLVDRLNKAFGPPAIVQQPVVTSGRRWQKLGFWRNTLMNQAVLLRWRMGADVQQLANWYQNAARR